MRPPPAKATLTILTLLALMKAPDLLPAFQDYKVLDWRTIPAVLEFAPRPVSAAPLEDEQLRLHPDKDAGSYQTQRIVAPEGALDNFFEALHQTEGHKPGAVTRIVHYGDSPTTADMITGDVRRLLQKQFGNAGHGFCLMAKPWAWYDHDGITLQASGWTIDPASQSKLRDGFFGLGGVSYSGSPGASTKIKLKDASHASVEISYLKQPAGGMLRLSSGGNSIGAVTTQGPTAVPGFAEFVLPANAKDVSIESTDGAVRAFGILFRKQGPGVSYDSLGLNGAYVSVLARMFDEKHWAEQLRHRQPHLVIINYGTNESGYAGFLGKQYVKELTEIVRRIKAALPNASVLLMSPMDRGTRTEAGHVGTLPTIPRLVTIQQQVAADTGCGFFNTFQAMGGEGTMGRWYAAEPRLVGADFIHPMPAGARIVGNLLYRALMDGYNQYKLRLLHERMKPITKADARR